MAENTQGDFDVVKELNNTVQKITDNRETLNAVSAALGDEGNWEAQFMANWHIAKNFFFLGAGISQQDAEETARDLCAKIDDWGSKLPYVNNHAVEAIIVAGKSGAFIFGRKVLDSKILGYEALPQDTQRQAALQELANNLLSRGFPMMGLTEALDLIVDRGSNDDKFDQTIAWFQNNLN